MLLSFQERLEGVLGRLEAVSEGVEGLAVPELTPLPRPSPLLTQWAWRPTTCPLQGAEPVAAQHWLGLPSGGGDQPTG